MKLLVIGFGQCGGQIADEFSKLNARARSYRGFSVLTGVYAVNTDAADLSGPVSIPTDYQHRILIGSRKTGGHGVGKINDLGAEVARDDADKIIDAIRVAPEFYESDAFLLIAGASGGTGSGALPTMARIIKDRYQDKPVYTIVTLPFEHELTTEELAIYNTATCIKSTAAVADAVILVDNQRYVRKDFSLKENISRINQMVTDPFFNLLCAGEEKKVRHIGAKVVDAGDIIQTLSGFSAIGYGRTQVDYFNLPLLTQPDFHTQSAKAYRGIQAMDQAVSELSLSCDMSEVSRAIFLLSGPQAEMSPGLMQELARYLRANCPRATLRSGDYPREKSILDVSVIISGIASLDQVRSYYLRAANIIPGFQERRESTGQWQKEIDDAGQDLPSLL
jgi:tubulin-like protein CetZ